VYFATYEVCKQRLGGNVGHGHHPFASGMAHWILLIVAAAGMCAAITSEAFMNPFDGTTTMTMLMKVIKQRMQVHGSPFRSVMKCATSVYHTEGLRAFYISYPTTLMMSVPFNVFPSSYILNLGHPIRSIRLTIQSP
jgi:solute carrier family 25 (mitochondrial iron transporter), member 28/37